jgi:hypothetical protein
VFILSIFLSCSNCCCHGKREDSVTFVGMGIV